jgi:hypothetical protein
MESELVSKWAWRFLNLEKCVRTETTRFLKVRRSRLEQPAEHPNFYKESKPKPNFSNFMCFLKDEELHNTTTTLQIK